MINMQTELKIVITKAPEDVSDNIAKQKQILKEFHDNRTIAGHSGIRRTLSKIRQRYIWKGMNKDITHYIQKCKICAANKQTKKTKQRLQITQTPKNTFEIVQIDTVGPLRPSNNYRYIITMQCDLSKYIILVPVESKDAKTVAKAIVENLILKYGSFKTLKTDLGTEFVNETLTEICKILEIEHVIHQPRITTKRWVPWRETI